MESTFETEDQFFLSEFLTDEEEDRYPLFRDYNNNYDEDDEDSEIEERDSQGRPYPCHEDTFGELDELEPVSRLGTPDIYREIITPTPNDFQQQWLTSFLLTLRIWMETKTQDQRSVQCQATLRTHHSWKTAATALVMLVVLLMLSDSVQAATHENVIFESIGEMAGATSYLHVQATISLSSLTQQFELYKNKLKARFTDPHRVSQVMNAQFAKNLNVSVNRYLDGKREQEPEGRSPFEAASIVPAPHMNTAVVWTRIAQLHFEDLYEIGLHLSALKSLLPRLTYDNRDRVVAASNFFKNIQPNLRKDNVITDNMEVENEFLEQYPDLQIPDHLSQRMKRSTTQPKEGRLRFDRGFQLFQAPPGTRLEDWYLCTPPKNRESETPYWFYVCPFSEARKCTHPEHIPMAPKLGSSNRTDLLPDVEEEDILTKKLNLLGPTHSPVAEALIQTIKDGLVGVSHVDTINEHPPEPITPDYYTEPRIMRGKTLKTKRNERPIKEERTKSRQKRLAGLIALPIAVAASAMGIYNSVQIEYLKSQLTEIKENTGRLFSVVDNHETAIQDLEAGMNLLTSYMIQLFEQNPALLDARFSRIENQLRDRIRQATHALQAAQHRRLSVDLLSPNQVHTMFERLNTRAAEFNCDLLVKFPSDLLQLEVSMLYDGEDAHLLLHVPMMPKESVLRLFRLHPFPLPLTSDHFLIPDVKNDVLAVSSTDQRLHVQLSSIDLMGCHRMNQLFLCDQFGVLSKKFNKTCLGALYMQNFKSAQKICEFNIEPVSEQVYPLRKNRFLIYLPAPLTVPVKCVNGTKTEKHLSAGSQTFTLSSGCEAQFLDHLVLSDLNIKMPTDVLHFTWDWVPADLFDEEVDQVAPELRKLAQLGVSRPKLKDLQYRFSASSWSSWGSWNSILLYVVIGVLTILMMVLGGFVCMARKRGAAVAAMIPNNDNGLFSSMLAMMGLQQQQQQQANHRRDLDHIRVRFDNADQMEEDRRIQYDTAANRYPDITTRPEQLLTRLHGMQSQVDQLKERNKELEENKRSLNYPTAPSVQNPNVF